VGAFKGLLYVRAEYPLAIRRLDLALRQARERGFLGQKALGPSGGFDIVVVEGAGAFVCGEETALIAALEGRRPMPRARPPFPAKRGLWDRPTLINNVETFANVPGIVARAAEQPERVEGQSPPGTKIFALTGAVRNIGLVEVPLATPLRDVVIGIGGGPPGQGRLKAVQIGGPSGGCLPATHLATPLDYASLEEQGAMMGSGSLVVLDDGTCMVNLARRLLEFSVRESCGKCPPCRIGARVMLNLLERITQGRGEAGDLERLETLGEHVRASSLCGLGRTASSPTLSTLRHFRAEYEAHILERRCPAGTCRELAERQHDT
jgi:NADH:ubiquinone oxidoreductase subunit F (NADH-binding)